MKSIITTNIFTKNIELICISESMKHISSYPCLIYNNFQLVICKGYDKQYEQISIQ